MRASSLVVSAAALAISPPAAAQLSNFAPRDLTRGVAVAGGGGPAGDFDATAVSWNPAGLATLGSFSAAFAFTALDREDTVRGGGGMGLFLGVPLRLPLPNGETLPVCYGFGFESIQSPDSWPGPDIEGIEDVDRPQDASLLRNGLAFGFGDLSFGYLIDTFFWTGTPQRDSVLTHQIGLSFRPSRFASAGLNLRDIFEPVGRASDERFARSVEAELAVRPLGDWRLELAASAVTGSDDLVDARVRALVRPRSGIALYGAFESVERHFGDAGAPLSRDARFTVGLTIDGLAGLVGGRSPAVAASYDVLTSSKGVGSYAGSSVLVRFSTERYPAVRERSYVEEFAVDTPGSERELAALLLAVERAGRADGVAGVLLDLRSGGLPWGAAEELRGAIARLRARRVPVAAYVRSADMTSIYVASACDRVYLHPSATVRLRGVASQLLFLPDLLARLGVGVQVVQIGDYKSAGEPFTRTSASPESREQVQAVVDEVDGRFAAEVARGRGLAPADVRAAIARPSITAREAVGLRLADAIHHPDELEGALAGLLGRRVELRRDQDGPRHATQWAYPRIAVVYVAGDIVPGARPPIALGESSGGDEVADAIRQARESRDVRAIILRVNSPGGQIEPSERIAREVELTRGKKPILVSIGGAAASGGYMVAAGADRIIALPTSVTGSIGVLGLKMNLKELLDRVGIRIETVQRGAHADADSMVRPWTDDEVAASRRELADVYERFVAMVARARRLSPDAVRKVGEGRIWTGASARGIGLVDRLGGFLDALDLGRRAAGLGPSAEIEVVHLPARPGNLLQRALAPTGSASLSGSLAGLPPVLGRILRAIPASLWWDGPLARMPIGPPLD